MPIAACPSCQTKLRVGDAATGQAVKCPKCGKVFRLGAAPKAKARPVAAPPAAFPKLELPEEPVLSEHDLEVVDETADEPVLDEGDLEVVDEPEETRLDVSAEAEDEPAPAKKSNPFKGLDVPREFQQQIKEELSRGESIVWVGRPSVRVMQAKAWIAVVIGAVFACIGVGLWVGCVVFLASGNFMPALPMAFFGLVLLAFGVLAMCSRYLIGRFRSARDCYILTNRRALVFQNGGKNVRSYSTFQVAAMNRQDSAWVQGAGDLVFEVETQTRYSGGQYGGVQTVKIHHGFLSLENVRKVEKLLRETLVDRRIDKHLR
jgi:predicted Zn finger-like uncharacterized protein